MRDRIGDLSKPWRCPPSLEKVFAKRRAARELRRLKGEARKAAAKHKRPALPRFTEVR